ncbi:MAG: hypothetical protein GF387_03345 [Candidatus Portnoybacteria bacterium]|nr:hypothetical protein [Candidatus Portnoybacteria bacterium]
MIPGLNKKLNPLIHNLENNQCKAILEHKEEARDYKAKNKTEAAYIDKTFNCNAGKQSFHINSEGALFMCKIERKEGFSILDNSFKKAWNKLKKTRKEKLNIIQSCINCKEKEICNICPPLIRLYNSVSDNNIYCYRTKLRKSIKNQANKE